MRTWTYPSIVISITDGDTLRAELDLGLHIYRRQPVRLVGIDAPELSTTVGKQARDFVRTLLPVGAEITVVSRSLDKYGRVLGEVLLPLGGSLADVLVERGLASYWSGYGQRPTHS